MPLPESAWPRCTYRKEDDTTQLMLAGIAVCTNPTAVAKDHRFPVIVMVEDGLQYCRLFDHPLHDFTVTNVERSIWPGMPERRHLPDYELRGCRVFRLPPCFGCHKIGLVYS